MQESKSLGLKEARKIVDTIIEAAEKSKSEKGEGRHREGAGLAGKGC
jgi:hypothetical protein